MEKCKKIAAALVLALIAAFSALSSCTEENAETKHETEETKTMERETQLEIPIGATAEKKPDIIALLGLTAENTAAYWDFKTGEDKIVKDLGPAGADFKMDAGESGGGMYGAGLTLKAGETLTIDTGKPLSGFDEITISFWIKMAEVLPGDMMIIAKDSVSPYDYRVVISGRSANGHAVFSTAKSGWYQGNNVSFWNNNYYRDLTENWAMLTFTYDGQKIRTYTNGIFDTESIDGALSGKLNDTSAKLYIGRDAHDSVDGFNGTIDELLILKKALTDDEIAAVHEAYTGQKTEAKKLQEAAFPPDSGDYQVAVYYFPQWHADPENAKYHGDGWSEWEQLKQALPKFPGHEQPKIPLWGYEDEALPSVMEKKIDAAADHGVDAFIFDWYYSDNGRILYRCLDEGYLGAQNKERVKFALMWANHDIIVGPGIIAQETWTKMRDHIIEKYFSQPCYWRIDEKLYFSVYEIENLLATFGNDVEKTAKALEDLRKKTREAGYGEIHLNLVEWGINQIPGEVKKQVSDKNELMEKLGADSVTSYVWVHHTGIPAFPKYEYSDYMEKALLKEYQIAQSYSVPYFGHVSMGWDSSPRTNQDPSEKFENKGYPYGAVLTNNAPELFKQSLAQMKAAIDGGKFQRRIITINSWNEWGEGSYIEPDAKHGMGYLEAIREVFGLR